ncbi:hypothetical protein K435DRAFT_771321 [Dendrothele bispora CBS 962.96]|uniref:BTB domain-containing protein n=1 Tax=Dendrothele bispora (strain CBS 962.96) TaxID=1314807 RepID=A0A4S8KKH4_DENBC|nr:hypothetical protein K435DRAFT_771321 [Dendrothele bispora CBS 962.96]
MSNTVAKRSEAYYWKTIIFQVEGILFRVPRFHFETSSEVFSDMFALPQTDELKEGDSDASPIRLEGIMAADFECLLNVLYPRQAPTVEDQTLKDEWVSVLKLTTLWRFLDFRKLAIEKLNGHSMNAYERVALGKQYYVYSWLRSGYVDLVHQSQELSMEHIEKIGYVSAVHVFHLREEVRRQEHSRKQVDPRIQNSCYTNCTFCQSRYTCNVCVGCVQSRLNISDYLLPLLKSTVEKAVDQEFKEELEEVQTQNRSF